MLLQCFLLSYKFFDTTTKKCLDSLLPQALSCGVSISVGDNASPDNSSLLLSRYHDSITQEYPDLSQFLSVSHFDQNFGYAGGMNRLASNPKATWLLLIGSDTVFAPDSLKRLSAVLGSVPNSVGIVGPVTNSAGTAQSLYFEEKTPEEIIDEWQTLHSASTDWCTPIPRADFFCVAIRKSLWQELKGLDEGYGRGYYEDIDFCVRAKKAGFTCNIAEDCFVFHQGSATFGSEPGTKELIRINKQLFLSKNPNEKLLHVREDTLNVITASLNNLGNNLSYGARLNRIKNRMQILESLQPKSFYKRLIWSFRARNLSQEIEALF
jgi:GT2 family glycosyltransferase